MAQRWAFSEDLKTITFYLRKNARWSNDEPLDARDFLYSLRRILAPAMANQMAYLLYPISGAEAFNRGKTTNVDELGVRIIDNDTLEIKLNNPTPYFLELLAGYLGYPVPQATTEAYGKTTDRYSRWTHAGNLVGNGPFTLKTWRMQRDVTVSKNPYYWDAGQVALNGIVFHAVESSLIQEKMFRVGQLHYTTQVPLSKINAYRAQPNSPYQQKPMVGTYYYMFNIERPPVDDVRVRRALLRQAESIFIGQVPLIPFYTYNSKHLIQPSVHGAPANVSDLLNYKYVSLDSTAKAFQYEN